MSHIINALMEGLDTCMFCCVIRKKEEKEKREERGGAYAGSTEVLRSLYIVKERRKGEQVGLCEWIQGSTKAPTCIKLMEYPNLPTADDDITLYSTLLHHITQ
jgi:hypothetical protein